MSLHFALREVRTLRLCRQRNLLCVLVQTIAGKVNSPSEVYCKECCAVWYSTLGWCGLLGPRPRGGMCPAPPTRSGHPYSTPQSGLLLACKYFFFTFFFTFFYFFRPRGGMCPTPPTLSGHPYSTPQSGLLLACKYFQITSGLRSGLRSGLPFSCLVWS